MLFEKLKNINPKNYLPAVIVGIIFTLILFAIICCVNDVSKSNIETFSYTVKVRDTVEELDKIFERAEVNVNVMADSIGSSYDIKKQQDKNYNMNFINNSNALVKSVLTNSPGVNGSWFQLNADLPFSTQAFNWFEFKGNQFIDVKGETLSSNSLERPITPEDDPYYFDAVSNQKPTWSKIYKDADTQNSMITISAPVYNNDSLVGVVGIDIATDNLQDVLRGAQMVLGDSDLFLLNQNDEVLLSQLEQSENPTKNSYKFLTKFEGNGEGPIEYFDHFSNKTAIKLSLSNDYKFVIAIENKKLFRATNLLVKMLYLMFLLLMGLTAIFFIQKNKESFGLPTTTGLTSNENETSEKEEVNPDDLLDKYKL